MSDYQRIVGNNNVQVMGRQGPRNTRNLVGCPDCATPISRSADECRECGYPIRRKAIEFQLEAEAERLSALYTYLALGAVAAMLLGTLLPIPELKAPLYLLFFAAGFLTLPVGKQLDATKRQLARIRSSF
ncbi:hypothetical protein [Chitinimonas sp.]|uniref:hypothetical protein n=1 Tax=Chitinimonas sp. TaxID=1934313 RepID=UPI0035AE16A1